MTRILHIIHELSGGGPTRVLLNVAGHLGPSQGYTHKIAVLSPVKDKGRELANKAGIEIVETPSPFQLYTEMELADIVQVEWWNCSHITPFLFQPFPSCRLVFRYHVAGDKAPHIITPNHLKMADMNVIAKSGLSVFDEFEPKWQSERIRCILAGVDFNRMPNIQPRSHERFNVGYIGTVNFVKMHPGYVAMSNRINIPNVQFVVCGSVSEPALLQQVHQAGAQHKFNFMGYVENLDDVIAEMDVFGYPLCPDTYASTEMVLQEVMYAGIPPVVFPYGGVTQTVKHNENGYVVQSAEEYANAIEYLYHHPKERKRLGEAGREFVTKHLGVKNTILQYQDLYADLMSQPKRPHRWGMDYWDPASKEGSQPRNTLSMAEMFMESLGTKDDQDFRNSFSGSSMDKVLRADINIQHSRYVLAKNGVIRFRNLYPEDPYLNLWAGLCCEGLNDAGAAATCYSLAITKGCRIGGCTGICVGRWNRWGSRQSHVYSLPSSNKVFLSSSIL